MIIFWSIKQLLLINDLVYSHISCDVVRQHAQMHFQYITLSRLIIPCWVQLVAFQILHIHDYKNTRGKSSNIGGAFFPHKLLRGPVVHLPLIRLPCSIKSTLGSAGVNCHFLLKKDLDSSSFYIILCFKSP